jgi:hypothetical protein
MGRVDLGRFAPDAGPLKIVPIIGSILGSARSACIECSLVGTNQPRVGMDLPCFTRCMHLTDICWSLKPLRIEIHPQRYLVLWHELGMEVRLHELATLPSGVVSCLVGPCLS